MIGRLRRGFVAAVSALVVLAGAAYVLGPAGPTVRLSAAEVSGVQPYDQTAAVSYRLAAAPVPVDWSETVYGSVVSDGPRVSGVLLTISGAESKTTGQSASFSLKVGKAYRADVHLKPGRYLLSLTLKVDDKTNVLGTYRTLSSGKSYRISAQVQSNGSVLFPILPVSSY